MPRRRRSVAATRLADVLDLQLAELVPAEQRALDVVDLGGGTGGSSGMICFYAKLSDGAPPEWGGGPSGAPYFWQQTWDYGEKYKGQYDLRVCPPVQCKRWEPLEPAVACPLSSGR